MTIAGVVTPLGLYDALEPSDDSTIPKFEYRADTSAFGLSTPPRSNLPFNRLCQTTFANNTFISPLAPCPYSDKELIVQWNGTTLTFDYPNGYNNTLPAILHNIYSSGTGSEPTTVSNFFDIQWRQYSRTIQGSYQIKPGNGSEYLYGTYGAIVPLFLDERYYVVEGLVVDTKTGAVGFRNHSVPAGDQFRHGAVWSEDLLFIEPETRCVDTNLTLEFTLSATGQSGFREFFLVDNGGFVNLNQTYPFYDHDNAQNNPDIQARAYKAAYLHNAWSMAYLNVTSLSPSWRYLNSTLGQKYPMRIENNPLNYRLPRLSGFIPNWLLPGTLGGSGSGLNVTYPNPYNVTADAFKTIGNNFLSHVPEELRTNGKSRNRVRRRRRHRRGQHQQHLRSLRPPPRATPARRRQVLSLDLCRRHQMDLLTIFLRVRRQSHHQNRHLFPRPLPRLILPGPRHPRRPLRHRHPTLTRPTSLGRRIRSPHLLPLPNQTPLGHSLLVVLPQRLHHIQARSLSSWHTQHRISTVLRPASGFRIRR